MVRRVFQHPERRIKREVHAGRRNRPAKCDAHSRGSSRVQCFHNRESPVFSVSINSRAWVNVREIFSRGERFIFVGY
jgi:hypothetical protein